MRKKMLDLTRLAMVIAICWSAIPTTRALADNTATCVERMSSYVIELDQLLATQVTWLEPFGKLNSRYFPFRDCDADPLLVQSLAQMLLPDPGAQAEADRLLRRSVRVRPHAAAGYFLLASQRWEHQHFPEAVELYRTAACLDDREEQFADAYAKAATVTGQGPEPLRLFQHCAELVAEFLTVAFD